MSEAADRVVLEESWKTPLLPEFEKPYMRQLREFLVAEKRSRKVVYPKGSEIFAALNLTPLPDVRVVVIGQDPYHGPNQAHGLCFSVRPGVPRPPSLENIFQEVSSDVGGELPPGHGCLIPWAKQGVLLLNSVLTVVRGRAGSHQGRGWETFTDRVVEVIRDQRESVVFMLWGSYAQRKGALVDTRRHLVLSAPHPSPLSATRGFFGCRHFSSANRYLQARGFDPIDWFAVD
ncbi:MAG: uracil-DNA glycosylase [Gammaproteobacteria bacterium]|nr:uracil-DNA glycosylase [Gammaproteobacteria bacterium]